MSSFRFIIIYTLCFCINKSVAQNDFMDYTNPREYTLAAITVDGVLHFDHDMIIQKSGLIRGEKIIIPGEKIATAIDKLWEQGIFKHVEILKDKSQGDNLFLRIRLQERERMSRYSFSGISKSEADQLRDDLDLYSGKIITDALLMKVKNISKNYFVGKGYFNAKSYLSLIHI